MRLQIDNLGKVAVTVDGGYWDIFKDYDKLTIVEVEGKFKTYISRKPVPAGTSLGDREYWIPFSSLEESVIIDYNKHLSDLNEEFNEWISSIQNNTSNLTILRNILESRSYIDTLTFSKTSTYNQLFYNKTNVLTGAKASSVIIFNSATEENAGLLPANLFSRMNNIGFISDIDTNEVDGLNINFAVESISGANKHINTIHIPLASKSKDGLITSEHFSILNKKNSANGVLVLNESSLIDSEYLPSYVDDVLEYEGKINFPIIGEKGKIYVDTLTNATYRWGGSKYFELSNLKEATDTTPGLLSTELYKKLTTIPSTLLISGNYEVELGKPTLRFYTNTWDGEQYSEESDLLIELPLADTTQSGFMSANDKEVLNNIHSLLQEKYVLDDDNDVLEVDVTDIRTLKLILRASYIDSDNNISGKQFEVEFPDADNTRSGLMPGNLFKIYNGFIDACKPYYDGLRVLTSLNSEINSDGSLDIVFTGYENDGIGDLSWSEFNDIANIPLATQTQAGLMSSQDKADFDALVHGAGAFIPKTALGHTLHTGTKICVGLYDNILGIYLNAFNSTSLTTLFPVQIETIGPNNSDSGAFRFYITDISSSEDYSEAKNIVTADYLHDKFIQYGNTTAYNFLNEETIKVFSDGSHNNQLVIPNISVDGAASVTPYTLASRGNANWFPTIYATINEDLEYTTSANLVTAKYLHQQLTKLDNSLFILSDTLPETDINSNKIYVVPSISPQEANSYTEWIYANGAWEKIGESQIGVDLTEYYTKTESDARYLQSVPDNVLTTDTITDGGVLNTITSDVRLVNGKLSIVTKATYSETAQSTSIYTNNNNNYLNIGIVRTSSAYNKNYWNTVNLATSAYLYSTLNSLNAGDGVVITRGTLGELPTISLDDSVLTSDNFKIASNTTHIDSILSLVNNTLKYKLASKANNSWNTNNISNTYEDSWFASAGFVKQGLNSIIPGNGITIETYKGTNNYFPKISVNDDVLLAGDIKTEKYTQGSPISFNAVTKTIRYNTLDYNDINALSFTNSNRLVTGAVLKSALDNIIAGPGITIETGQGTQGNVPKISCTLDTEVFKVVTELPTEDIQENKIYLVPKAETGTVALSNDTTEDDITPAPAPSPTPGGGNIAGSEPLPEEPTITIPANIYDEYIYVNGNWELIGTRNVEVDLSEYLSTANISTIGSLIEPFDASIPVIKFSDNKLKVNLNKGKGIAFNTVDSTRAVGISVDDTVLTTDKLDAYPPYPGTNAPLTDLGNGKIGIPIKATYSGSAITGNPLSITYNTSEGLKIMSCITSPVLHSSNEQHIYTTTKDTTDYSESNNLVTAKYAYDKFALAENTLTKDMLDEYPAFGGVAGNLTFRNGKICLPIKFVNSSKIVGTSIITSTYTLKEGIKHIILFTEIDSNIDYSTSKNIVTGDYVHNKFVTKAEIKKSSIPAITIELTGIDSSWFDQHKSKTMTMTMTEEEFKLLSNVVVMLKDYPISSDITTGISFNCHSSMVTYVDNQIQKDFESNTITINNNIYGQISMIISHNANTNEATISMNFLTN